MSKTHSPLLGFNTNIKHKGKVFHIQTEDSGVKHPHVITHLFADGGRILKSTKTSYAEYVGGQDLTEKVRALMKDQHKAMFMALRDGEFDSLIDEVGAPGSTTSLPAVTAPPAPPPAPPPPPPAEPVAPRPAVPRPAAPQVAKPLAAAEASGPPSRLDEIDTDALERAAAEQEHKSPIYYAPGDMPPPPAALLASKRPTGGGYRALTPTPPEALSQSSNKYVASRPAAIFANTKPAEGGTVFGESLISDKSLDEVILSFLHDEVDANNPGTSNGA